MQGCGVISVNQHAFFNVYQLSKVLSTPANVLRETVENEGFGPWDMRKALNHRRVYLNRHVGGPFLCLRPSCYEWVRHEALASAVVFQPIATNFRHVPDSPER
jgi:hypothetical protein